MVVTDLDGTLFNSKRQISQEDWNTLEKLGDGGILRVVCTGRNLFAARKALSLNVPIDYLIFSSGAGTLDWKTGEIIQQHSLAEFEVHQAVSYLEQQSADYMIHRLIPDNHYFSYRTSNEGNADFLRRIDRYSPFALPLDEGKRWEGPASQLLAVVPEASTPIFLKMKEALPTLSIIRATSPLDGKSMWLEIFPQSVAKSKTAAWLAKEKAVPVSCVLAVGNDYNDEDLLHWSGESRVVANAIPGLRSQFQVVPSHNHHGFTEAVRSWMPGQCNSLAK